MSQLKEWHYKRIVSLCVEHRKHYISAMLNHNNKSIKRSFWLRMMGLMETWDMSNV